MNPLCTLGFRQGRVMYELVTLSQDEMERIELDLPNVPVLVQAPVRSKCTRDSSRVCSINVQVSIKHGHRVRKLRSVYCISLTGIPVTGQSPDTIEEDMQASLNIATVRLLYRRIAGQKDVDNETKSCQGCPDSTRLEPPSDAEASEAVTYLNALLNKTLHVHIADGRMFVGQLKCTDNERNIILATTQEFRHPCEAEVKLAAEKHERLGKSGNFKVDMKRRFIGLVVVPGQYITKMEVED
nr:n-alpha-acetyltransferase 38, natc auxiliary subunit [Quercus suber]